VFETPDIYTLASGTSEGTSKLGAFDNAILKAGVGNTNLIKLSSILPPNSSFKDKIIYPRGVLVPIAYGAITSDRKGELIAAAVAIAISVEEGFGVIMEYSGVSSAKDAEETVRKMAEDAMNHRNIQIKEIKSKSSEHVVENFGCAFAAVPMWYSKLL
jgi:arginine decarboxylase